MVKPRGVLIAGNWKMNQGPRETEQFFVDFKSRSNQLSQKNSLRACLIPPCVSLEKAKSLASQISFPVAIAAQNAHWEKKGAYTGEISGPMLQEMGIEWVLLGHSERRQYFGETDVTVRKRAESLLEQGFQVILCIGESKAERETGKTSEVLTRQLNEVFSDPQQGASRFLNGKITLAYEPVWAIGTGLTATPAQAEEAHQLIRKFLLDRVGKEASEKTPILYGGSVTPENIDSLLDCRNIDGALVGGASLKPDSFLALLQSGSRALA